MNIVPKKGKNRNGRNTSAVKAKKKALGKMTREIAALKTQVKELHEKREASSEDEEDDTPQDNAGDQFGGRASKKSKKKKRS